MVLALGSQVVADDPGSVHGEGGAGGGGIIGPPADDPPGLAVGVPAYWQVWQGAGAPVLTYDLHRFQATAAPRQHDSYPTDIFILTVFM